MTTPPRQTLTARSPEDLLAVARVVLGFDADDSVVMLTLGPQRTFHARVDLPHSDRDLDQVAQALAGPARRHGVAGAVLLLYTDDTALARRALRRIRRRLEPAGVDLLDAMRVEVDRWYPLLRDRAGLGTTGVPYDVSAHPFVVQAVLDGRVLHGSRRALAATLEPDPDLVAQVSAARPTLPAAEPWVHEILARHLESGTTPEAPQAARLLEAIAVPRVRDCAWSDLRRPGARDHVRLWSGLVRGAPDDLLPHAAAVLAFGAWVAGDGALAWCAVDRAREVDPGHSLAGLVADLLTGAVSPDEWEQALAQKRPAS